MGHRGRGRGGDDVRRWRDTGIRHFNGKGKGMSARRKEEEPRALNREFKTNLSKRIKT